MAGGVTYWEDGENIVRGKNRQVVLHQCFLSKSVTPMNPFNTMAEITWENYTLYTFYQDFKKKVKILSKLQ